MSIAAVMVQASDMFQDQFREVVRGDAILVVLGIIVSAAGFAVLLLTLLKRRSQDRSTLWFAVFCCLYGIRMLARTQAIHLLFNAPPALWHQVISFIDYVIPLPALLFFRQFFAGRWKTLLKLWVVVQIVNAVVAITAMMMTGQPGPMSLVNNLLVIVGLGSVLAAVVWQLIRRPDTPHLRVLGFGLLCFYITAIYSNLPSLWGDNPAVEPAGFFIFVCCLGYVTARRVFANERRLVEIERELQIARQIQASIIPQRMPKVSGLRIAAHYRPMTAVAGDLYDFMVLDDQHIGILIADVSGHGVPAALIASMVKTAFSLQTSHAAEPARVMAGLNQVLCRQLDGQFVTAAYLFIDIEKKVARYAGAGHPPLLVWRKTERDVQECIENGLVLGFMPAASYLSAETPMSSGDRFLLYTDGVSEASNGTGVQFGDHQFRAFIAKNHTLTAKEFVDSLIGSVSAWSEAGGRREQQDDITLLAVDVLENA